VKVYKSEGKRRGKEGTEGRGGVQHFSRNEGGGVAGECMWEWEEEEEERGQGGGVGSYLTVGENLGGRGRRREGRREGGREGGREEGRKWEMVRKEQREWQARKKETGEKAYRGIDLLLLLLLLG